ncbi:hypothetical protein NDU88_002869 [Pleurodeles waltl]|uniref:Uncharacterized protein n=1 Tax=Pleurodeles waltl TaxID=8319 RepID=A0AAV7SES6_PLEWA|nr:hypothetical protein NDU88_002869 [Pleurodeles waltl]
MEVIGGRQEQAGPSQSQAATLSLQEIQLLIQSAVAAAFRERGQQAAAMSLPTTKRQHIDSPSGVVRVRVRGEDDFRGRYVQGQELKEVLQHIKDNLALALTQMAEESGDFFLKHQRREPDSRSLYASIKKLLDNKWQDLDKNTFPRNIPKRYEIYDIVKDFSLAVNVDSVMAGLSSQGTIISEEGSHPEPVYKRVDSAVKRSYATGHFSITASAYLSYTVQSLMKNFQSSWTGGRYHVYPESNGITDPDVVGHFI